MAVQAIERLRLKVLKAAVPLLMSPANYRDGDEQFTMTVAGVRNCPSTAPGQGTRGGSPLDHVLRVLEARAIPQLTLTGVRFGPRMARPDGEPR
jgi:hypothetical protein